MNEPNIPATPEILPQATAPVNYGPVGTPQVQPPQQRFPLWIIPAIVILVLVAVVARSLTTSSNTATPGTTTQSPTPTPTGFEVSTRNLSSIATRSAFIEFETQLDIVTRGIQNAPIDNQSILPPRLDLPLGF